MAKTPKKPLDAGVKRTMKIVGATLGVGVAAMGYMLYSSNTKSNDINQTSRVGPVVTSSARGEGQLSEATRAKLARVHEQEAQAAQRAGKAYIPEMIFGEPIPVSDEPKEEKNPRQVAVSDAPPEPPEPRPVNRHANEKLRPTLEDQARKAQLEAIQSGLVSQMQMMSSAMRPATPTAVAVTFDPMAGQKAREAAAQAAQAQARTAAPGNDEQGIELIGGDEIVAAVITTPVDTDKSTFAMAEIVGGKLAGALLRGQVVPMSMSGDIEDVGLRFTSMRFNGKQYQIDAIALNEQTASDALDGSVDRRVFSRYVMPIVMAGMSGVSTYSTARGTPSVSVATNGDYAGEAVIVDQERATKEDAKYQGIGDMIDKGVQTGDRIVNKAGNRPNRVELPTNTAIGVIFNKPVMAK